MDYKKSVQAEAECYGQVYNPKDYTVTFCYRGAPSVVVQPEHYTDAQIAAIQAYVSAFGVTEFKATKAAIEKDIGDAISAKKAAFSEAETKPLEV